MSRAVHRLIAAARQVQEEQLEVLEQLLLIAGERSSSIPDPHHVVEGEAADRLIAQLLAAELRHPNLTSTILSELGFPRSSEAAPARLDVLAAEFAEFSQLQSDALRGLDTAAQGARRRGQCLELQAAMAASLFDVLSTRYELMDQIHDAVAAAAPAKAPINTADTQRTQSRGAVAMVSHGGSLLRNALSAAVGSESKGGRFASMLVEDGANRIAARLEQKGTRASDTRSRAESHEANRSPSPPSTGPAPRSTGLMSLKSMAAELVHREASTASSNASWKNEFHQAVMRTMLRSESPQQAVAEAVATLLPKPRPVRRSHSRSIDRSDGPEATPASERRHCASRSPSSSSTDTRVGKDETVAELARLREESQDLQTAATELLAEAQRMIMDCDAAVVQLSSENDSLRSELIRLKSDQSTRHDRRDAADDAADSLLSRANASAKTLQREAEEWRRRALAREEELRQLGHRNAQLQDQVHEAAEQQQGLTAEVAEQRALVKELQGRIQAAQRSEASLQDALEKRNDEHERLVQALRSRVKGLEAEASTSFERLEEAVSQLRTADEKLSQQREESKRLKLLFTKMEAQYHESATEVRSLKALLQQKDVAVQRLGNVVRLRDAYGQQSGGSPNAGAAPSTPQSRRGATQGRLVRLSFDSPAREATPSPQRGARSRDAAGRAPQQGHRYYSDVEDGTAAGGPQLPPRHALPTSSPTKNQHVYKVLADAAQLLSSIKYGHKPIAAAPSGGSDAAAVSEPTAASASVPPAQPTSLRQSVNRAAADVPLTQQLLHELERKEQSLMQEAASLADQERSVLEKRSVVSSTLLAQRNQLLMKNAPDEDVEKLNNQISAVMERINQAAAQIQQNKRTVEGKMDLLQRQRRVLLGSGGAREEAA